MKTPPLYSVAKFLPYTLFNIYLNWAIDNEKRWNGLDKQKGYLTSRFQQACIEAPPLSPERKDGIYASYVKSTRKTIPNYNRFVFESGQNFKIEYNGGILSRDGDSLVFIKNGAGIKKDIASTMTLNEVVWNNILEDMLSEWKTEYATIFDYAVALGNELKK